MNLFSPRIVPVEIRLGENFSTLHKALQGSYPTAKIYFLNPDSSLSSSVVGSFGTNDTTLKKIKNSIVNSGNVYVFVRQVVELSTLLFGEEVVFGYRQGKRYPRRSYNKAITYLMDCDKHMKIIEPINFKFNVSFDELDRKTSMEENESIAVYRNFEEFIARFF